jgi:Do/DeqQ family serine protease
MNVTMKNRQFLTVVLAACVASALSIGAYKWLGFDEPQVIYKEINGNQPYLRQTFSPNSGAFDFVEPAEKTTKTVVHITSTKVVTQQFNVNPFGEIFGDDFFGDFFRQRMPRSQKAQSSGSGVILSEDGYIVTNNHVIEGATEMEVVLHDKRSYKAKLIGTDPSTDLALIKIEEKNLPSIALGNSDNVKVGEWVLAVGNPFNLESTVTAGIVSAKGRNINILKDRFAIESFIQTDAAVNPGNSGGALVNIKGELIGINTAIATPTGTYAGYSFAVPVNIMKKVVEDLRTHGIVQRAYLGISHENLDGKKAEELSIKITEGVIVKDVLPGSAAKSAGIEENDVIVEIDKVKIRNSADLQESIARHRPGDKVNIKVYRNGSYKDISLTFKEIRDSSLSASPKIQEVSRLLGADLELLREDDLKAYKLKHNAVRVNKLTRGKLAQYTDMQEGFIITKIGGEKFNSLEDFAEKVLNARGGVMLEGFYPGDGTVYYYAFGR